MIYAKHFIPLESDPDVFTKLMHNLGAEESLQFIDVWSLDDPDQLAIIPRPVHAFILVLATDDNHERDTRLSEIEKDSAKGNGAGEKVLWFKQTIHNACGLYALLHAVCNVNVTQCIKPNSLLDEIVKSYSKTSRAEREKLLEDSKVLEDAHRAAATQGSTQVPDAEAEVDHHYICFVKGADGGLYELDGTLEGSVCQAASLKDGDEVFFKTGLDAVREYMKSDSGSNPTFSLLALVDSAGLR